MKFLIAFTVCALAVCINANPYGNSGYNSGGHAAPRVAYVQQAGYGGGYGGGNSGGYGGKAQPLISQSSNPSAAAGASAVSAGIRPGRYDQLAVIGYEIDASYNGNGNGQSYGRSAY